MKIILPPHNKISAPVSELTGQLKKDIEGMEELMRINKFTNGRGGFAVAHCQVSQEPYRIFVAKETFMAHSVVINPRIIEKSEPFTAIEGCLSYPFRPGVKVKRYYKIKVRYQDRYLNEHEREFEGTAAQVFQHETEHFNGKDIYNQSK